MAKELKLTNIIKHFHVAPKVVDKDRLDVEMVNFEASKRGYIVQPGCCSQQVLNFIESETWNPNSGFYKTWEDVQSKSRLELFMDQILHYASTYGTNYQGEVYCPNGEPISINYNAYTVIEAIEPEDLYNKLMDVLKSGIALSTDLLNEIIDYIEYVGLMIGYNLDDINNIKNKEALIMLCEKLHIMPSKPNELVRYLYYKVFDNAMVIASKTNLNRLYNGMVSIPTFKFTDDQIKALAQVFNRHKKFLLGLKKNKSNVKAINKISRLSKTLHKPMRVGFWENITNLSDKEIGDRWAEEITKLDNPFKVIRLIEMINLRKLQNENKTSRLFIIRNGKTYFDKDTVAPYPPILKHVKDSLIRTLAEGFTVDPRNPYVKYPTNVELNCPSSEKMFLGNLPFGSSFALADEDGVMGVYWRNEWGTRDFDLHYLDKNGSSFGWNASYYDGKKTITFSGDMTNADPEAAEMFYMTGEAPDGYLTLNRFNGEEDSKYRLFFGQEKIEKLSRGYMVDPNHIQFQEEATSTAKEQIVGLMVGGRYYPILLDRTNNIVSIPSTELFATLKDKAMSYLPIREVLEVAGFKDWKDRPEGCELTGPSIDLSDYKKDTLIKLFSEDCKI